jgi:hypothetical protein
MVTRWTRTRPQRSDRGRRRLESDAEERPDRMPSARCPICATRVGPDDALGLIDGGRAHAECALVHWLRASEPGNHRIGPVLSRRDSRSETSSLIDDLQSLCRGEHKLDT